MEWRIGWRTPAFRLAVVAALILGLSIGGEPGRGVALSAYGAAEAATAYMGFTAIVWMSLAAVRETTLRTDSLIFSKPQPGEWLALSKFLGGYVQILVIAGFMFLGCIMSRSINGGLLGVEVFVIQYARSAIVLLFASVAGYMLALLFDSALAGSIIGLYWLLILSGKAFLAKYYFPSYSQNLPAYFALSLTLLFVTLFFYRRARRGSAPVAVWVRAGIPIFIIATAWQFWSVIRDGHDPEARLNPVMDKMGEQDTTVGRRAAGFTLPDQNGKLTGLGEYEGKILLIALWSPRDPDSVLLLDRLNDVVAQYGKSGVQPVALTICEDSGATSAFAFGERLNYPVLADWGTYNAPKGTEFSPLSSAYRVTSLPALFITDRRRQIRNSLPGIESYDGERISEVIKERLDEEPR